MNISLYTLYKVRGNTVFWQFFMGFHADCYPNPTISGSMNFVKIFGMDQITGQLAAGLRLRIQSQLELTASVVNPDPALRQIAQQQQWAHYDWRVADISDTKPGMPQSA